MVPCADPIQLPAGNYGVRDRGCVRSSNLQAPTSREIPTSKIRKPKIETRRNVETRKKAATCRTFNFNPPDIISANSEKSVVKRAFGFRLSNFPRISGVRVSDLIFVISHSLSRIGFRISGLVFHGHG